MSRVSGRAWGWAGGRMSVPASSLARLPSGLLAGLPAVLLALVPVVLVALGPAGLRAAEEAELPLKRIVMFSSGVGYFERRGDVEGNATVELQFEVKDINDLLKSMVLQDLGGGKISTVTYASRDPVTRTLKTFAIDLTSQPTLAEMLRQVRGERVEIEAPERINGIILGVETRQVPAGEDKVVEVPYLNLLTDEGLRSVNLTTVGRIKLASEKLDAELRQALAVLAQALSTDKKAVTLQFLGEGKRPIRVGYVQESPIWKTSYRLVLGEGQPHLQGWAIVENTSEADWENVNLTLISGRPISFVMDLYEPLYIPRPVVEPELFASLRPRTYEQDLRLNTPVPDDAPAGAASPLSEAESPNRMQRRGLAGGVGALARSAGGADEKAAREELRADHFALAEVQSAAQAEQLGELFQYQIAEPVSVKRQTSAMLPIVGAQVSGEKVSVYNPQVHAKHPLAGLRLKNTTELHLMQGPITVFDHGSYAGDAQIMDIPPGAERLITYSVDLETEVAPESKGEPQQLVSVRIAKGTMHIVRKQTRGTDYTVKNSGQRSKTVLVEYPLEPQWKLVTPSEPAEKTRSHYRFAVAAEPGKPSVLEVREERTVSEQQAVTNLPHDAIVFYINAKEVSAEVKQALREVVRRRQVLADLAAQRAELQRQVNTIGTEQTRLRENLKVLPPDSEIARTYIKKFAEQEQEIDTKQARITMLVAEETKARQELDEYLLGLEVQ